MANCDTVKLHPLCKKKKKKKKHVQTLPTRVLNTSSVAVVIGAILLWQNLLRLEILKRSDFVVSSTVLLQ
jgi:hypothetical protein